MKRIIEILEAGVTDKAGKPLSFGSVQAFLAGTTTPTNIFRNFACTDAYPNPATLDAAGRLIAYTDKRIKLIFRNSNGEIQRIVDDVSTSLADIPAPDVNSIINAGLVNAGGNTIAVDVDNESIEIFPNKVRVKDKGVNFPRGELISDMLMRSNYRVNFSISSGAMNFEIRARDNAVPSTLNPVYFMMQDVGTNYVSTNVFTLTSALSITVPASSSLGITSSVIPATRTLYLYFVNHAGTPRLAVSLTPFDERIPYNILVFGTTEFMSERYSTVAMTNVFLRHLANFQVTRNTTTNQWTAISNPVIAGALEQRALSSRLEVLIPTNQFGDFSKLVFAAMGGANTTGTAFSLVPGGTLSAHLDPARPTLVLWGTLPETVSGGGRTGLYAENISGSTQNCEAYARININNSLYFHQRNSYTSIPAGGYFYAGLCLGGFIRPSTVDVNGNISVRCEIAAFPGGAISRAGINAGSQLYLIQF